MGDSAPPPLSDKGAAKAAFKTEAAFHVVQKGSWLSGLLRFFRDDPFVESAPIDVKAARLRFKKAAARVQRRMYIVLALVILNILLAPLFRPTYHYVALSDDKKTKPLMALLEPNQTDQSVLSWAATSITEIMTFGFGDFDQRITAQRSRFTAVGWRSFLDSLIEQNLRENIKGRQLVLTTVPTDSPVIVSKGEVEDDEYNGKEKTYRWIVEMPVIMTYTTNNNVSSASKGIVRLTIVRVSGKQNPTGIGIKTWRFM